MVTDSIMVTKGTAHSPMCWEHRSGPIGAQQCAIEWYNHWSHRTSSSPK